MMLRHSSGMVRESSHVPEMTETGISLFGTKGVQMDADTFINSVSCALLSACNYRLVCCFTSNYQSHPEKVPLLSESVPFLDSDTVLPGFWFDVVELFLYSIQELETLGILGGHDSACIADGVPGRLWMARGAFDLYSRTDR